MKRILITGAAGFIGRHCLPILLAKGYDVHAVCRRNPPADSGADVQWHAVDLFDPRAARDLVQSIAPELLMHLAWHSDRRHYYHSIDNFRCVQAGLDLLTAFHSAGGKRLVFAGSCAEYDWRFGQCTEDLTPLAPQSPYGTCKNALQQMVASYCRKASLGGVWGRIFFTYGPGEHPGRLVASVITALIDENPALCTHGNQIRDYLYVKDIAAALVDLLDSDAAGPVNICSGRPVALKDIILAIARQMDRTDLIRLNALPASPDEPEWLFGDNRQLRRLIDWQPRYELDQGIAETIAWWRKNMTER